MLAHLLSLATSRFESLQGHRISRVSLAETLNCQGAPCWIRVRLRRPQLREAPLPSHARWQMLAHLLSLATSRFESLQGHRISRVSLAETLNCQGAPCWIRTNGLLLRRQTLSSPELMGRNAVDYSERRCFLPHYTQVSFAHRNESTCAFPMLVPCAHVPQVNLDGNETPCPQIGIHCTDTVSSVRTCGHAAKGVP